MTLFTGKTAELADVSFVHGLMGARVSLRCSWFVPLLLTINYAIYSTTWGVIIIIIIQHTNNNMCKCMYTEMMSSLISNFRTIIEILQANELSHVSLQYV